MKQRRSVCQQSGRTFTAFAFLTVLSFPGIARPQETAYEPGAIVMLHELLGDQCSFVPDLDVADCCAVHDMDYQAGGTELDRWLADLAFRNCIRERNRPVVAEIYYSGVRLFGWLFFNYDES